MRYLYVFLFFLFLLCSFVFGPEALLLMAQRIALSAGLLILLVVVVLLLMLSTRVYVDRTPTKKEGDE